MFQLLEIIDNLLIKRPFCMYDIIIFCLSLKYRPQYACDNCHWNLSTDYQQYIILSVITCSN